MSDQLSMAEGQRDPDVDRFILACSEWGQLFMADMRRVAERLEQWLLEMRPAFQAFGEWARETYEIVYPVLRQPYNAAGCPYGPDDEGMFRWLGEIIEAASARRNERERDALERERQQMITDWRDRLASIIIDKPVT